MLSFKDYLKEKCQSQESPKNKHFTVQLRCKVVILNRFHLKCNLFNYLLLRCRIKAGEVFVVLKDFCLTVKSIRCVALIKIAPSLKFVFWKGSTGDNASRAHHHGVIN